MGIIANQNRSITKGLRWLIYGVALDTLLYFSNGKQSSLLLITPSNSIGHFGLAYNPLKNQSINRPYSLPLIFSLCRHRTSESVPHSQLSSQFFQAVPISLFSLFVSSYFSVSFSFAIFC